MQTYSTSDIAHFLGTERTNINYYIRKGHLNATMIDGNYSIKQQDYYSFRDEYYDTNLRHSTRGISKKLTDSQVKILSFVIADMQNNTISLNEFENRYKKDLEEMAQFKDFILYKRDVCIRYENKNGSTFQELANDFTLSIKSIQNIIKQKSEF